MMKLNWLDTKAIKDTGLTFGIPWEKGKLKSTDQLFKINDIELQTWPTAYWPDKSIKWTGHAAAFDHVPEAPFELSVENQKVEAEENGIQINQSDTHIIINNNKYVYEINKSGSQIIEAVKDIEGNRLIENLRLVASIKKVEEKDGVTISKESHYTSLSNKVTVELEGNKYTVIKIEGELADGRLPFTIRLKIFKDSNELKIISTQFYNVNEAEEFVTSLGLSFDASFKGSPYNKHVKLVTEEGVYNEASLLLTSRRHRFNDYYKKQIAGEMVERNEATQAVIEEAEGNAIWNDFKFNQIADGVGQYSKRTKEGQSWLPIPTVTQSNGLMHVCDKDYGLSFGLRDFSEKHPSQLSVLGLDEEQSSLTIWFWSPDGEAMDLRHYDNETHMDSAYEGFPEMRATPTGIANTSEAVIQFHNERQTDEQLVQSAVLLQQPPLLIASPEYYNQTEATGEWALVNEESEQKIFIEKQLDLFVEFYLNEINQRQWTGYWNFGDVMHTYDHVRSQWFYDQGGYAWQNTELVPNIWLWYSFFRKSDAKVFRFIEAMTRHNSEVDRYHFGEYKGLGTRHNVSHWGCGCKEARISMAGLFKYYYYLTADERTKDLLDDTKDADKALNHLNPLREYFDQPEKENVTHVRTGPDWSAFVSNWLSQWERNQDETYLNKIKTGLNQLKKLPYRLLSGPAFEYNTETSDLIYMGTGNTNGYHMIICFGAPQVWIETANLLEDDVFKEMLAEFGKVYAMSNEEKEEYSKGQFNDKHFAWPMFASGLMAYAANYYQDEELAQIAWDHLLKEELSGMQLPLEVNTIERWQTINEVPWITTNTVSQWCLNAMMALKYI